MFKTSIYTYDKVSVMVMHQNQDILCIKTNFKKIINKNTMKVHSD